VRHHPLAGMGEGHLFDQALHRGVQGLQPHAAADEEGVLAQFVTVFFQIVGDNAKHVTLPPRVCDAGLVH